VKAKKQMMVKCRQCGDEHPSMIQIDQESFKTSALSNNSEQCSKCGKITTYNKSDYFFR
jgi:translation initiation factor 2 beta subunit (eIF-2beta)/eIF-5